MSVIGRCWNHGDMGDLTAEYESRLNGNGRRRHSLSDSIGWNFVDRMSSRRQTVVPVAMTIDAGA